VANVAKHARATEATISIRFRPGAVGVRVHDDGVGFPSSPPGLRAPGRPSAAGSRGARVSIVAPLPLSLRVETEL